MGGRMRSKSHIRTEGNGAGSGAQEAPNSSQKKPPKQSQQHYSPCPKIPSAIDPHEHVASGTSSLAPLGEDRISPGRRSARHYQEQSHADKRNSANLDVRSVNGNSVHQQTRIEMMASDPYDRRSFDTKGQAVHRSAMHQKNSALMTSKNYDAHGLHGHGGKNTGTDNHYLPNISPNYTTASANHAAAALQSSTRTLTSIPHIVQGQQAAASQMGKGTGQHSPQM